MAIVAAALFLAATPSATATSDALVLKSRILETYPSLLYVDRYRRSFPDEVQAASFWSPGTTSELKHPADLVRALTALQDHHIAVVGDKAGKAESLGLLFRTATDGAMVVWRIFDAAIGGVRAGDVVLAVDDVATQTWLTQAATLTFGGNRRSRAAEAALDLSLGTPIKHQTAGLSHSVRFLVQSAGEAPRSVTLDFSPMNQQRATAMIAAVNQADLRPVIRAEGVSIGTLRLGAFAPQYDAAFTAAADSASLKPGTTDDQAMLAGYCAVTENFIHAFDDVARQSDVVVLDLRGNLGGFGRVSRLMANAIAASPPPATFDLFATSKRGMVRLTEEERDPSCGHITTLKPLVVLVDAGTRSAGEDVAAWLWASGAPVIGERTIGAGGGYDSQAQGFPLPESGYSVRVSGNFTLFDPREHLKDGDWSEREVVTMVSADRFSPSRDRPFAIQSVGLRPDLPMTTTLADLRDGGVAQIVSAIQQLRAEHRLEFVASP